MEVDLLFLLKVICLVSSVIIWQFVIKMIFSGASKSAVSNSTDYHMIRRAQHMSTGVMIQAIHVVISDDLFRLCINLGWMVFGAFCVWRKYDEELNKKFIQAYRFLLRPYEYQGVPGSFFYLFGLAFVAMFCPRYVFTLSLINLAFGDPFASLSGIYFKSPIIRKGRSVAGTIGGALASCLFTFISINLMPQLDCLATSIPPSHFYPLVFLISGIAELAPSLFDDNLTIPIYSGILYTGIFKHYYGITCP